MKKERTVEGKDILEETKSVIQVPPSASKTAQVFVKMFDRPALNNEIDLRNPSKLVK